MHHLIDPPTNKNGFINVQNLQNSTLINETLPAQPHPLALRKGRLQKRKGKAA